MIQSDLETCSSTEGNMSTYMSEFYRVLYKVITSKNKYLIFSCEQINNSSHFIFSNASVLKDSRIK